MAIAIVWFLFGLAAAAIAHSRGHSQVLWFFGGILLGPFALLFALVQTKDDEELARRAIALGTSRPCPKCAELVKRAATVCRYCGEALEALPPIPEGAQAETAAKAVAALVIILSTLFVFEAVREIFFLR